MSKNTVRVYDTITKKYVEIEVSESVRTYYNRTQWNIDDNDESFYKHEIQFSSLTGGTDRAFENFHEFIEKDSVENYLMIEELNKALKKLTTQDRELIEMLYYKGMNERECAAYYGINQKNIHKKKVRILDNLHKLLEKNCF